MLDFETEIDFNFDCVAVDNANDFCYVFVHNHTTFFPFGSVNPSVRLPIHRTYAKHRPRPVEPNCRSRNLVRRQTPYRLIA
jgi:hypothetical protein